MKAFIQFILVLAVMTAAGQAFAAYNVSISGSTSSNGAWSGGSPNVWTPSASGSNVSVADIQTLLSAGTGVTITTLGAGTDSGDITVTAPFSWSANTLTLNAAGNININAVMTASGTSGLTMLTSSGTVNAGFAPGSGNGFAGRVDFPGRSGSGFLTINGASYTVINSLGLAGSVTAQDLQGINGNLAGNHALGADIDASGTSTWNYDGESMAGFLPLGNSTTRFTGVFNGLGHTISNIYISRPLSDGVGLFGRTNGATVSNVGLSGGDMSVVSGHGSVGALVGYTSNGTISNVYCNNRVSGDADVGGLVGYIYSGTISNVYGYKNRVVGDTDVGGLVGQNYHGTISRAYRDGGQNSVAVNGASFVGGLVGENYGTISGSYVTNFDIILTGTHDPDLYYLGGLVGLNGGTITDVYAKGVLSSVDIANYPIEYVGGLVGYSNGTITNAYSDVGFYVTSVPFTTEGGLVGANGGTVTNGFWNMDKFATSPAGTGKTTAELMNPATFTGWNISATGGSGSVWRIYSGQTYPLLLGFMAPLSVTANDDARLSGGSPYSGGNGVSYSPAAYNASLVSGAIAYGGTSQGATATGSYSIIPTGLYSGQQGYDISYNNGALNISATARTLTVTDSGTGGGTVAATGCTLSWSGSTGSCTAPDSTQITLSGTADNLSAFNGWWGGSGSATSCSGTAPCTFTMTQNSGVSATFNRIKFTVTPSAGANGTITPNTPQTVAGSATAAFTIRPNTGYQVTIPVAGSCGGAYTGDPTDPTSGITWTSSAITSDCTVSAAFSAILGAAAYNVTISSAPSAGGTWSGGTPDVWTPGGSGANVALGEIQTRLNAGKGVNIITNFGAGESGDILVTAPLSWSSGTLGLYAARNIDINTVMSASAASVLSMGTMTGTVNTGFAPGSGNGFAGRVDFPGRSGSGFLTINGASYTVINSPGLPGSVTALDLQGINGNLAGNYALGADIDASGTSAWNNGGSSFYAGFLPLGSFTGVFDGLGHTVGGLVINRPASSSVGLFGTSNHAIIRNTGLLSASVTGASNVGGLVGIILSGTISNAFSAGSLSGTDTVGGLVGSLSSGTINNSFATASVTGASLVGGLVGGNGGAISSAYATGSVTGASTVGGLVGENDNTINNAYATGSVSGTSTVGGLVGENDNTINNSFATGSVSGTSIIGGLTGLNYGTISNGYWDADTTKQSSGFGDNQGSFTGGPVYSLTGSTAFSQASYSGFNISAIGGSGSVWRIYSGQTYPLLRSFLAPLTVTANDAVKAYDGNAYSGGNGVSFSPYDFDFSKVIGTASYAGSSQGATAIGSYTIIPGGLYSIQQGYDISYVNGALNITPAYTLTLTFAGSGAGSVTSTSPSFSCNTGCTHPMPGNTQLTLTAAPEYSLSGVWSGCDSVAGPVCNLTMNSDWTVGVTFTKDTAHTARIDGATPVYYPTLAEAYAAAVTGNVIEVWGIELGAALDCGAGTNVTIHGGYDQLYQNQSGMTTVQGPLKIEQGSLTVERLIVK